MKRLKITEIEKREALESVTRVLAWFLILLPVILAFTFVSAFGVNVPLWDQWGIVPLFDKLFSGTLSVSDLFAQHNEHRIVFPRIAMLLLGVITGYNNVAEMYLILACLLATLVILLLAFKVDSKYRLFLFLPIPFLLFSLRQYGNMLNGLQIVLGFAILFAALAFYCLYVSKDARFKKLAFPAALVSATVASFSFAQGLLVWPVGVLQLFATPAEKPAKRFMIGAWSFIGLVEWLVYFYFFGYIKPSNHPSLFYVFADPVAGVGYFLTSLGSSLFWQESSALVGGLLLFCLAAVGVGVVLKDRRLGEYSFWLALLLFSFLCLAAVAVGRSGSDIIAAATSSRYTAYSILAAISIYTILAKLAVEKKTRVLTTLLGGMAVLVLLSVPVSYTEGIRAGSAIEARSEKQAFILYTYKTQPDEFLAINLPFVELHREWPPILEKLGYNVFSKPREEALLPPLSDLSPVASPTLSAVGTVNDQPVEQQQTQPVVVPEEESSITVAGWAVDARVEEAAGGVYVDIDGKLFPAFYGTDRQDVADAFGIPSYRYSGFERAIPVSEIGDGTHELSIVVLTHDRKGYYRSEELALKVKS